MSASGKLTFELSEKVSQSWGLWGAELALHKTETLEFMTLQCETTDATFLTCGQTEYRVGIHKDLYESLALCINVGNDGTGPCRGIDGAINFNTHSSRWPNSAIKQFPCLIGGLCHLLRNRKEAPLPGTTVIGHLASSAGGFRLALSWQISKGLLISSNLARNCSGSSQTTPFS